MQIDISFWLWSNPNQRPRKPRDRHQNYASILLGKRVFVQTRIFSNGRLISIIMQNAQGCQAGTNRILNLQPSKISNLQKNFVGTPKPRIALILLDYNVFMLLESPIILFGQPDIYYIISV